MRLENQNLDEHFSPLDQSKNTLSILKTGEITQNISDVSKAVYEKEQRMINLKNIIAKKLPALHRSFIKETENRKTGENNTELVTQSQFSLSLLEKSFQSQTLFSPAMKALVFSEYIAKYFSPPFQKIFSEEKFKEIFLLKKEETHEIHLSKDFSVQTKITPDTLSFTLQEHPQKPFTSKYQETLQNFSDYINQDTQEILDFSIIEKHPQTRENEVIGALKYRENNIYDIYGNTYPLTECAKQYEDPCENKLKAKNDTGEKIFGISPKKSGEFAYITSEGKFSTLSEPHLHFAHISPENTRAEKTKSGGIFIHTEKTVHISAEKIEDSIHISTQGNIEVQGTAHNTLTAQNIRAGTVLNSSLIAKESIKVNTEIRKPLSIQSGMTLKAQKINAGTKETPIQIYGAEKEKPLLLFGNDITLFGDFTNSTKIVLLPEEKKEMEIQDIEKEQEKRKFLFDQQPFEIFENNVEKKFFHHLKTHYKEDFLESYPQYKNKFNNSISQETKENKEFFITHAYTFLKSEQRTFPVGDIIEKLKIYFQEIKNKREGNSFEDLEKKKQLLKNSFSYHIEGILSPGAHIQIVRQNKNGKEEQIQEVLYENTGPKKQFFRIQSKNIQETGQ
jgi:hypothetical protein